MCIKCGLVAKSFISLRNIAKFLGQLGVKKAIVGHQTFGVINLDNDLTRYLPNLLKSDLLNQPARRSLLVLLSTMEIHHRRARPSSSNGTNGTVQNGASHSPPRGGGRTSHPVKARTITTKNPYAATSTLTDIILLRSIQLLLFLAAMWFLYLIVAINSPDNDRGTGDTAGVRGGTVQLLPNQLLPAGVDTKDIQTARNKIKSLREEFYKRYGGEAAALAMLKRGVRTFEDKSGTAMNDGGSVRATANRFLSAVARSSSPQQPPEFVMAFGGYSVTVGRGNHLEQSYPFVLQRVLSPILELPPLGIKLTVRNSAIGGIPSFPYGWCLSNFLGDDADLVSWDYGMNEGNGASGLESYVRQSLMLPKSPPLFVLLDLKSRQRSELLQKYVNMGVLPDPIALGNKDAVDKKLLTLPEGERPTGLQKWDEWGAPKGAPGQSPWHPKKMEHELIGWMLAMHMLDGLDVALDVMEKDADWRKSLLAQHEQRNGSTEVALPPPVTDFDPASSSLLHGSALDTDASKWHMNHISCRTSFLPNLAGDFDSIVQSGVVNYEEDMLHTRNDSLFNKGWVMDVGKLERDTKLKVQKYGGLGYIDMKTALYGVPSSGTLKLWLPHEATKNNDEKSAAKYFNAVVLCEVNEKRGDAECNMLSDLSFRVGDAVLSREDVSQVKGVASYLKKDICIRLNIPEEANISSKSGGGSGDIGLPVEVTVTGKGVTRENGACSISHVIWENK